jgi:hypothetical protein
VTEDHGKTLAADGKSVHTPWKEASPAMLENEHLSPQTSSLNQGAW